MVHSSQTMYYLTHSHGKKHYVRLIAITVSQTLNRCKQGSIVCLPRAVVCCVWCRRRRFRPASSVPSPRNCSPLSQTWAAVKNEDSSASNWKSNCTDIYTDFFVLCYLTDIFADSISIYLTLLTHSTHAEFSSFAWNLHLSIRSWYSNCSSCLCCLIIYHFCLRVWTHLLQLPVMCSKHVATMLSWLLIVCDFVLHCDYSHCYVDGWLSFVSCLL